MSGRWICRCDSISPADNVSGSASRQAVIIDCDPGIDDSIALLWALSVPERLDVLAITTVAGNASLECTTRNARIIRELADRPDVPIHAGCRRPLKRSQVTAGHFHGASGLGSIIMPEPVLPAETAHAAEAIVSHLHAASPDSVTLVLMGPMTNVARAMTLDPELATRARRIVLMGGARREGGNITASAEYNIFADPHAAQQVFASGCPITVLGLDATHQVRVTPERVAGMRGCNRRAATFAAELLDFTLQLAANDHRDGGVPLHDPCTIAWLLEPTLFVTQPASIEVETESPLTLGHTAVELRVTTERPANAAWTVRAAAAAIFRLMTDNIARLP